MVRFDYEYDTYGNEIIKKLYFDGTLQYVTRSDFDDSEGRIIYRITSLYPSDTPTSEENYEYGPHGITNYSYYDDTNTRSSIVYEYFDDGRLRSETHNKTAYNGEYSSFRYTYEYDQNGNVSLKKYSEKSRNNKFIDKYYYSYKYDNKGNCLSEIKHDANYVDPPITVFENVYDEKGRLIKNIQNDGTRVTEYKYDRNGNLIKEDDYKNGELRSETTREYNERGQLVKETTLEGSLAFITEYKYDKYGNVVERANGNQYALTITEYGGYTVFYKP